MTDAAGEVSGVQMVTVGENNEGQRLDNFLIAHLKGVPRSWVYRVLRRGEVRVNKGRCKPARRLQIGDVVRIPPLRVAARTSPMPSAGLVQLIEAAIVYESGSYLILNKPAGVAVHGGSGLAHGVIETLRASRPEGAYLELAHRLDRETSGCLMIAKKRSVLRQLQELQRDGGIEKCYLALLAGRSRKGRWQADVPLKKNTLKSGERIVRVDPQGKRAVTNFVVAKRYTDAFLVHAELETGRTHQIRVHAAFNRTPILGDPKYGDEKANRQFQEFGLKRLFLHAVSLKFKSPEDGARFQIEAPLPTELQSLLENLDEREEKIRAGRF